MHYTGEDVPLEIRKLFNYMRDGIVSNSLTKRLDDAVCAVKLSEKWRSDYMKELLYYEDLREDARAEGLEEGRAEGVEVLSARR